MALNDPTFDQLISQPKRVTSTTPPVRARNAVRATPRPAFKMASATQRGTKAPPSGLVATDGCRFMATDVAMIRGYVAMMMVINDG